MDRQPWNDPNARVTKKSLRHVLSIPTAEPITSAPHVGNHCQFEKSLKSAVLAESPVKHREHHIDIQPLTVSMLYSHSLRSFEMVYQPDSGFFMTVTLPKSLSRHLRRLLNIPSAISVDADGDTSYLDRSIAE